MALRWVVEPLARLGVTSATLDALPEHPRLPADLPHRHSTKAHLPPCPLWRMDSDQEWVASLGVAVALMAAVLMPFVLAARFG